MPSFYEKEGSFSSSSFSSSYRQSEGYQHDGMLRGHDGDEVYVHSTLSSSSSSSSASPGSQIKKNHSQRNRDSFSDNPSSSPRPNHSSCSSLQPAVGERSPRFTIPSSAPPSSLDSSSSSGFRSSSTRSHNTFASSSSSFSSGPSCIPKAPPLFSSSSSSFGNPSSTIGREEKKSSYRAAASSSCSSSDSQVKILTDHRDSSKTRTSCRRGRRSTPSSFRSHRSSYSSLQETEVASQEEDTEEIPHFTLGGGGGEAEGRQDSSSGNSSSTSTSRRRSTSSFGYPSEGGRGGAPKSSLSSLPRKKFIYQSVQMSAPPFDQSVTGMEGEVRMRERNNDRGVEEDSSSSSSAYQPHRPHSSSSSGSAVEETTKGTSHGETAGASAVYTGRKEEIKKDSQKDTADPSILPGSVPSPSSRENKARRGEEEK
ncbi:hypothetical protein CSUI_011076, partial [Cystoisospora suis]